MKSKNLLLFITLILVSCTSIPIQVSTTTPSPSPTLVLSFPTNISQPPPTKTTIPTQTLTSVPTSTFAPLPARRSKDDYISGIYKLDRGNTEICVLKVVLEPLILTNQEIDFEIFCKHGPPSYNSGHAMAKIMILDNKAIYSSPKLNSGETCQLVFEFNRKMVTVKQSGIELACGFGRGISVDGNYKLISPQPPVLGCMDDDNPCQLDRPIP